MGCAQKTIGNRINFVYMHVYYIMIFWYFVLFLFFFRGFIGLFSVFRVISVSFRGFTGFVLFLGISVLPVFVVLYQENDNWFYHLYIYIPNLDPPNHDVDLENFSWHS